MVWQTVDMAPGGPAHRVWCRLCGHDWTESVAAVAALVAGGAHRSQPVDSYCECGSEIRVVPMGGTLRVADPLRVGGMPVANGHRRRLSAQVTVLAAGRATRQERRT